MNRKVIASILAIVLLGFGLQRIGYSQVVDIPDTRLRARIERVFRKGPGAPITKAEMATLTKFSAPIASISDLTGLEFATSLTSLDLSENSISDISALEGLTNLTSLVLSKNSISDISVLADLTNLTGLSLGKNSVSDISAVEGLTNLTWLYLGGNSVLDISAVAGLTNLILLDLEENSVSDISAVAGLTKLRELFLRDNSISDLSALAGLTNLEWLFLDDNSISDLSGLEGLKNLTWLDLPRNSISDLSPLGGLANLVLLDVQQNLISDISALSSLTNLRELYLGGNSVSDILALAGLTNLTSLYLNNNSVSDISALSGLTNLKSLYLHKNSVSDISALSGLTNLEQLYLNNNLVSDISVLAGLTNLSSLYLVNNSIADLSPLVANTGMKGRDKVFVWRNPQVFVWHNLLSYPSIYTYIPTLRDRGVRIEFDYRTPQTLLKIAGDGQQGVLNTALANPFVVEVRDQKHTVFEGVPVTFTITTGSGTLSVEYTETDANGRAESTLTIGSIGTNTVQVRATDLLEPLIFTTTATTGFTIIIPKGVSLVHIPLDVKAVNDVAMSIDTVGAFFDTLGDAVNFILTYDTAAGQWRSYLGDNSRGSGADVAITDGLGLITVMQAETTLTLIGDALGMDGISRIRLSTGLNLVGLPLNDERLTVVSDLMRLPAFADVVTSITVYVVDAVGGEGKFRTVARAGDDGDIALTGDIAMLVTATADATVALSGSIWNNSVGINGGVAPR